MDAKQQILARLDLGIEFWKAAREFVLDDKAALDVLNILKEMRESYEKTGCVGDPKNTPRYDKHSAGEIKGPGFKPKYPERSYE